MRAVLTVLVLVGCGGDESDGPMTWRDFVPEIDPSDPQWEGIEEAVQPEWAPDIFCEYHCSVYREFGGPYGCAPTTQCTPGTEDWCVESDEHEAELKEHACAQCAPTCSDRTGTTLCRVDVWKNVERFKDDDQYYNCNER